MEMDKCCLVELTMYVGTYHVVMFLGILFSSLCSTSFSEDIFEQIELLKCIKHSL